MTTTPDTNDIVYNTHGIDFSGLIKFLYEKLTNNDWNTLLSTLGHWWNIYSIFAIIFSLICFVGFVYAKIRYSQLYEIEMEALTEAEARWSARYDRHESKNQRWEAITVRITENNPESWRIAIIEADILLEETLKNAGYVGTSLGEKLKSANPQSFRTIQDAWEAHKVRNEIAHMGSDFVLTKKIAQETITQFERVFKEFGII